MKHESRNADWLSVDAARDRVLSSLSDVIGSEMVALGEATDRILGEDLVSTLDLPPWDNSAMDGFAVRAADVAGASAEEPRVLRLVGDVPAGSVPSRAISEGEAMRVMTGAPVPDGADSVIRVEHTGGFTLLESGGTVTIISATDSGKNLRRKGEDIRRGSVAVEAGAALRPGEIGIAAALGHARIRVRRPPRVAILTSGDELVDVSRFSEVEGGRRIVSSNSYSLAAQVRDAGGVPVDLGIARDRPDEIRELLTASAGCDALVTVAGMSVGEHDYMLRVLADLGAEVDFWRVRMRPGSPFAFGRVRHLGGIPWFGMPGNPVSAMVTFELFVRPALLRLTGALRVFSPVVTVRMRDEIGGPAGLTRFHRVRLSPAGERPDAYLTGNQGSGILTSMVGADALVVVSAETAAVAPGEVLPAILFGGRPMMTEPGYAS